VVNVLQRILAAGSHLLSGDHVTSWQDMTKADQRQAASELVSAVERSSFMRADLSQSPVTVVVDDYSNIGE